MSVGAFELGGSHISVGVVENGSVGRVGRIGLEPAWGREQLLATLADAAVALRGVAAIGAAVPGPFDYDAGICTIQGLGKLEALYGADLRTELATAAQVEPAAVRFLNDAQAFVLGEAAAGAARGHRRVLGVTLGTGLGSAFLHEGVLVVDGPEVPAGGELYPVPFRGGAVEDAISGRAISARYDGRSSAAEIAARAVAGDAKAVAVYASLGADLAAFLAPWLSSFRPTRVVIGGSIARAWPLFAAALPPEAVPAARPDDAALLGAAMWASAAR
jgi:glucokinase